MREVSVAIVTAPACKGVVRKSVVVSTMHGRKEGNGGSSISTCTTAIYMTSLHCNNAWARAAALNNVIQI